MIRNFIHIEDNFLLENECDEIINYFSKLNLEYNEKGNYHGIFITKVLLIWIAQNFFF